MSLARAISLIDDRVYTGPAQVLSDPTDLLHRWAASAPSRNSTLLAATLRRDDSVEADFACDARGYLPTADVLAWAGASAVTVARLYATGEGEANAVQTTTDNQPPLDLTANPLRIGSSAGTSLVATIPSAINGAIQVAAMDSGVTVNTIDIPSGAYSVQVGNAFREMAILAPDTPQSDIDAVARNMTRAWRLRVADCSDWILATGYWNSAGFWRNNCTWTNEL